MKFIPANSSNDKSLSRISDFNPVDKKVRRKLNLGLFNINVNLNIPPCHGESNSNTEIHEPSFLKEKKIDNEIDIDQDQQNNSLSLQKIEGLINSGNSNSNSLIYVQDNSNSSCNDIQGKEGPSYYSREIIQDKIKNISDGLCKMESEIKDFEEMTNKIKSMLNN
jgi:hypothetical protein